MPQRGSWDPVARAADRVAAVAGATGLLRLLEAAGRGPSRRVHVLTYHRVADPDETPDLHPGLVSATPDEFERQMSMLAERRCVVSLEAVLEAARGGAALPPGAVLLTFDDAYADVAEHAWPVLRRHGLPATLFVPTAYADGDRAFWWDRLHRALASTTRGEALDGILGGVPRERGAAFRLLRTRIKALPHAEAMARVDEICEALGAPDAGAAVLDWPALRRVSSDMTLCPHTRTHPLLSRVSADVAREEVEGSLRDLEREVGPVPPVLAYPSGAWAPDVLPVLEELGIELAFTTRRGVADLGRHPPLLLPRIPVVRRVTTPVLRVQLLPQFFYLNPLWDRSQARAEVRASSP